MDNREENEMKQKKMMAGMTILGLTGVLAACATASAEPFEMKWGKDECETCKMKVMDEQFAAEAVMANGKGYAFDDIGCLMRDFYKKQNEDDIAAMYVKDFKTKEWVDLEEGTFVYDKDAKTPMMYNVISFAKAADAEAYIAENGGEQLDFEALQAHGWERDMAVIKKMKAEKMKKMGDMKSKEGEHSDMKSDEHGH